MPIFEAETQVYQAILIELALTQAIVLATCTVIYCKWRKLSAKFTGMGNNVILGTSES